MNRCHLKWSCFRMCIEMHTTQSFTNKHLLSNLCFPSFRQTPSFTHATCNCFLTDFSASNFFPPLSETHVIILLPDFKPLRLLTLFVINIYTCWTSPTAWSLPPVSHLSGFPLVIPITWVILLHVGAQVILHTPLLACVSQWSLPRDQQMSPSWLLDSRMSLILT